MSSSSLLKTILLGIITLGIYPLVVMSAVSNDINIVASRYDGKKTMHYCLLFFLVNSLFRPFLRTSGTHPLCRLLRSKYGPCAFSKSCLGNPCIYARPSSPESQLSSPSSARICWRQCHTKYAYGEQNTPYGRAK